MKGDENMKELNISKMSKEEIQSLQQYSGAKNYEVMKVLIREIVK
jgi:hypothetical protein